MRKTVVVWLSIILVFSSLIILIELDDTIAEGKVVVWDGVTYTTHAPIRIDGNADFGIGINGVSAGDGSAGNPWIIEGWEIDGTGYGYCLYAGNTTDYFEVRDCYLHNASGEFFWDYYWDTSLMLHDVQNATLIGNSLTSHDSYGIYLEDFSKNNYLYDNNISDCWRGIYIDNSTNTIVNNNTISYSQEGIVLLNSTKDIISNNTGFLNEQQDISLSGYQSLIYNNTFSNNLTLNPWTWGIGVGGSNNSIYNNTMSNNHVAYTLDGSNCTFFNNIALNNDNGLECRGEANNVTGNTFAGNGIGIKLYWEVGGIITNNTFTKGGIYIEGYLLEHWNTHQIPSSNTLDGKPLLYWKNQIGGTVPAGVAQVILANCSGVTIENSNLSNGSTGVALGFSTGNIIQNNTVTSNSGNGIYVRNSNSNIISNNTIMANYANGIRLIESNSNIIQNNTLSSNIYSGITFYDSALNIFANNTAFSNYYGIWLSFFSGNNKMYHNNFVDNTIQAYNTGNQNSWDNGYPSGGNYWSDYSGQDNKNGVNQNYSGPDGIGDWYYNDITGTSEKDYYPLMHLFELEEVPPNIVLVSPTNNSIITPGDVITFDIWDGNLNLDIVNCSINDILNLTFNLSYEIDTIGWADGWYDVEVQAIDYMNNSVIEIFNFTVDTTAPEVDAGIDVIVQNITCI